MLVFILQLLLTHVQGIQYIIFVDISKAFDRVWRGLLWHKMMLKGVPKTVIRNLIALYGNLRSAVKDNQGCISDFLAFPFGIGQGSPNSTKFFNLLTSDLPEFLGERISPKTLFGILIICLIFLS